MSNAILITGTTDKADTFNQILVVATENGNLAWTRQTNGGRGETNAWSEANFGELLYSSSYEDKSIVGEILSTELSSVDENAINNNERPIVLIQKLTKQYGLRHKQVDVSRTIADVIREVDSLISTDPTLLDKYRSDGRKDKTVTATKNPPAQVTKAIPPVIEIVRTEAPKQNADIIGDFVIQVPSKEAVGNYIPRTFAGGVTEKQMYDHAFKYQKNILLEGHAGTGKTTSPMHDSMLRGQGCYVVSCSVGIEVGHFIGKTIIKNNGEAGWVDGVLIQAMKTGSKLILDEVDFASPKILQRLQDVLQNRTLSVIENGGEIVKAEDSFMVVATYNNGYRHSNKLNEAFLDRFGIKLRFDYDNEIEKQVIPSKSLLQLADSMRADSINGVYSTPVTLRLLKSFVTIAKDTTYEFAVENFVMNFNEEERPSVKLLLEAHRHNLESELINN